MQIPKIPDQLNSFITEIEFSDYDYLRSRIQLFAKDPLVRVAILRKSDDIAGNVLAASERTASEIAGVRKPVIAELSGNVKGAWLDVALQCLIRIASRDVVLHLEGETITAELALNRGFVTTVCERDELRACVVNASVELAGLAPFAIAAALEAVDRGLELSSEQAFEFETELFGKCFATEDAKEGPRAFLEKRKPRFSGV